MNHHAPVALLPGGRWSTSSAAHDVLDARAALRLLRRRRSLIVVTTTIFTALTLAFAFVVTPHYTAQSTLTFEPRLVPGTDMEAALNRQSQDEASILSEIEMLKSRQLAQRVIDKLQLATLPEFKERERIEIGIVHAIKSAGSAVLAKLHPPRDEVPLGNEQHRAVEDGEIVDRFLDRLEVKPVGRSRVAQVSFTAQDPVVAANVANAVVDLYIVSRFEDRLQNARRTSEWLASHVQQLRRNVERAESAVEDYRREHNLLQGERVPLVAENISDLNKRVSEAAVERASAEANLAQAKRLVGRTNDLASLGQVLQSGLIQRLSEDQVTLERKEAEIGEVYGPRHPLMLQLAAEKQRLDEKIKLEVGKIIGNLDNQVQIARSRESLLLKNLSALKDQVATANADAVALRALERDAEANRLLLEKFMSDFIGTNAKEDVRSTLPDVRSVSQAAVPPAPAFPKPKLMVALGVLGGLLVGVALAFVFDAMAAGYHSAEEVEKDTGLTVLARVPKVRVKRSQGEPSAYVLQRPDSVYAEAIRALHVRLLFSSFGRVPTSIAFVSAEADEGKTTIALSIARLLAKAGRKVLLVDADLHRSRIAKILRLDHRRGLAELISDTAGLGLEDVVQQDPESGADVIVGGGSSGRGSELLTSGAFAATLENLERQYDHVLIDSPPLTALSDAEVLVSAAATTVLIVAWGDTAREVARYTAEQIKRTARSLCGVVLSKVDLTKSAEYGFGDSACYSRKARKYYAS